MNKAIPLVGLFAVQSMAIGLAAAQGMDMAVMQKWAAAELVRHHVEGVHSGTA